MEQDKQDCVKLKIKATKEKLDWQGNIVEDYQNYVFKWDNYDPQTFLESVIRKGDLSCVPPLTSSKSAYDFMASLDKDFHRNDWDIMKKYKLIESEPFNGIKYVVYDRLNNKELKWVME